MATVQKIKEFFLTELKMCKQLTNSEDKNHD